MADMKWGEFKRAHKGEYRIDLTLVTPAGRTFKIINTIHGDDVEEFMRIVIRELENIPYKPLG